METTQSVTQLNSFLRGEISAVETYQQALSAVKTPQTRQQLEDCESSHRQRVESLKQHIRSAGGTPSEGGGAWAAFAKVFTSGAKLVGEKAAIQALEAGEDHGLADYRQDLSKLTPQLQQYITGELLPAQEKTHRTMSNLKKAQA